MMSEKKNIYDLSVKEMRKLIRGFSNTLYGRTVFFLAYFVPMMAFLVMIGLVVAEMIDPTYDLFYPIVGTFFLFIGLFILGNIYYYHEIRVFSEKR
ncbi:hypothetical protein IJG11_01700 [Candidatus Saccharibacteria bacterium]|nr:hypothetical protein [Candidatus Saccharibacteria bacterium]